METPSRAAQVIISIIPIVGIIMGGLVIFFYLLYSHREKILMIEKGMVRKRNFDLEIFSLFAGLLLSLIGLSLTVFFAIIEGVNYSLLSGVIPLSCGISLIVYYILRVKFIRNNADR